MFKMSCGQQLDADYFGNSVTEKKQQKHVRKPKKQQNTHVFWDFWGWFHGEENLGKTTHTKNNNIWDSLRGKAPLRKQKKREKHTQTNKINNVLRLFGEGSFDKPKTTKKQIENYGEEQTKTLKKQKPTIF